MNRYLFYLAFVSLTLFPVIGGGEISAASGGYFLDSVYLKDNPTLKSFRENVKPYAANPELIRTDIRDNKYLPNVNTYRENLFFSYLFSNHTSLGGERYYELFLRENAKKIDTVVVIGGLFHALKNGWFERADHLLNACIDSYSDSHAFLEFIFNSLPKESKKTKIESKKKNTNEITLYKGPKKTPQSFNVGLIDGIHGYIHYKLNDDPDVTSLSSILNNFLEDRNCRNTSILKESRGFWRFFNDKKNPCSKNNVPWGKFQNQCLSNIFKKKDLYLFDKFIKSLGVDTFEGIQFQEKTIKDFKDMFFSFTNEDRLLSFDTFKKMGILLSEEERQKFFEYLTYDPLFFYNKETRDSFVDMMSFFNNPTSLLDSLKCLPSSILSGETYLVDLFFDNPYYYDFLKMNSGFLITYACGLLKDPRMPSDPIKIGYINRVFEFFKKEKITLTLSDLDFIMGALSDIPLNHEFKKKIVSITTELFGIEKPEVISGVLKEFLEKFSFEKMRLVLSNSSEKIFSFLENDVLLGMYEAPVKDQDISFFNDILKKIGNQLILRMVDLPPRRKEDGTVYPIHADPITKGFFNNTSESIMFVDVPFFTKRLEPYYSIFFLNIQPPKNMLLARLDKIKKQNVEWLDDDFMKKIVYLIRSFDKLGIEEKKRVDNVLRSSIALIESDLLNETFFEGEKLSERYRLWFESFHLVVGSNGFKENDEIEVDSSFKAKVVKKMVPKNACVEGAVRYMIHGLRSVEPWVQLCAQQADDVTSCLPINSPIRTLHESYKELLVNPYIIPYFQRFKTSLEGKSEEEKKKSLCDFLFSSFIGACFRKLNKNKSYVHHAPPISLDEKILDKDLDILETKMNILKGSLKKNISAIKYEIYKNIPFIEDYVDKLKVFKPSNDGYMLYRAFYNIKKETIDIIASGIDDSLKKFVSANKQDLDIYQKTWMYVDSLKKHTIDELVIKKSALYADTVDHMLGESICFQDMIDKALTANESDDESIINEEYNTYIREDNTYIIEEDMHNGW